MNPNASQRARTKPDARPRWFASPICEAEPSSRFSRTLSDLASPLAWGGARQSALVFNVNALEACFALLPLSRLRLCTLFQWPPLDRQPLLKRFLYRRLLLNSRVLATYSRESESYLRDLFPHKAIVWLGHFTDTDFFRPSQNRRSSKGFFLCVGDHKRHEDIIIDVASTAQIPIIRVSKDLRVAHYHAAHRSPLVDVRSGVTFEELRRLYDDAEAVLNIVDDSLWPVGITTFCEALAMDKVLVTSGQHSCSGYVFDNGDRPYVTVERPRDVDCWLAAIRRAQNSECDWTSGRRPRDMAVRFCSFESIVESWKGVISLLNENRQDA